MKYYLTTPIYYVNATPHIGHAYTTIVADAVKKFRRMMGDEAYLTTGTDEHGQKVERSARDAGLDPETFTTRVAEAFRRQWDELGIEYDFFRRTTDPKHARAVHEIFQRCLDQGAIYKDSYTGKYHVTDEAFVTEEEAAQAEPDKIITITEENYFFRLSDYQERLLKLYRDQPEFIQPETRRNEIISFVEGGLKDLSISRSSLKWGIPLPNDPEHVFYVWFDALTTYMSAIGYGEEGERRRLWEKLWPADVHIIGKEIVRFHAVYWPAFLMAAGLPLPKRIYAHGWLLFQAGKMSKSKGNIVRAKPIQQAMGADALRYYLMREIVFGQDGNFTFEALINRYNSDLANGLGNLASRTLSMLQRYCSGKIPEAETASGPLAGLANETIRRAREHYENFEFSRALEAVWTLLAGADKHIVEEKPWELAKSGSEESLRRLRQTLYNAAEVLRIGAALAYPALPESAAKIWKQLGRPAPIEQVRLPELAWGGLRPGEAVNEPEPVFPRLEVEKTVKRMQDLEQEALREQAQVLGKAPEAPAKADEQPAAESEPIGIEDFAKVDLRVGEIKSAERVKKADRLLHLKVDIGEPALRSIVAGIAGAYEPESLIGRRVVIVANLAPRKLKGIESNGMIVAATGEDGRPFLVGFHEEPPIGARLR